MSAIVICFGAITLNWAATSTALASPLDKGAYSIDYTVYQGESDSVSIANDYFLKPAILMVNDDGMRIQLTVNQSEWVKVLRVADGDTFNDVEIVSDNSDDNTRDIAFVVTEDLAEPIYMQMNIRIESMTPVYDHSYTVRYIFDEGSVEAIEPPPQMIDQQQESDTFDGVKLFIYAIAVLLIVVFIIILFNRRQRKE